MYIRWFQTQTRLTVTPATYLQPHVMTIQDTFQHHRSQEIEGLISYHATHISNFVSIITHYLTSYVIECLQYEISHCLVVEADGMLIENEAVVQTSLEQSSLGYLRREQIL
jgi:hypothetical protein